MISGQTVLGLITARGGSKGVPGKNIRTLSGKPLIAWTIESAKESKYLDRLILSTDDEAIISVAVRFSCETPFIRDEHLASDSASSLEVVVDALEKCPGYDWIVLLQPTSPFRSASDIDNALELCIEKKTNACVSVSEAEESPYWMFNLENSKLRPVIDLPIAKRRQDLPKVYSLNGAIYISRVDTFLQRRAFLHGDTVAYEMPQRRSIDIDTEADFEFAEYLLQKKDHKY
ncbi:cytidylyltransferase domain-containing protein [Leptospira stimsonii]|uniref:Acylneuraminate cytidylyltransferase n=1 Tax=Leptospira stimsonii TaxID=2202203 RepID=A0A396ZCP8_9LEPT|nr:acylneuraminate cytidylyltransferase family protein [Leptospira stimsonii]RHX90880.1 acylneuraminate cytidylyltransferase [Leptospira stimsonii]